MQAKLTLKSLKDVQSSVSEAGKPLYVWDTELSGFGAYVSPKGASWLVQKWLGGRGGKAVRQVIGRTRDGMDLSEARGIAAASIGDLHRGVDLSAQRRRQRQEVREGLHSIRTSDALDRFFSKREVSEGEPNRYRAEMKSNLRKSLSGFSKVPLRDITRADIRTLIEAKPSGASARNLFAALRPFFNFCVDQDLLPVSPMEKMNPPPPVQSRDRCLSKEEIKALHKASYHMPSPWGAFYRVLLLTGQRREEVAGMHSSEIDFEKNVWVIPRERAKNGKAHIVHLSPLVLEEIANAQGSERSSELRSLSLSEVSSGTPSKRYVFPAARVRLKEDGRTEAHISGYSKMKTKLDGYMTTALEAEGLVFLPWRVHDLRRTMASGLAEIGYPTDVVDRLLNHVSGSQSGVKGVYQRYQFLKEREEALISWADKVKRITAGGNVIEIDAARTA